MTRTKIIVQSNASGEIPFLSKLGTRLHEEGVFSPTEGELNK